MIKKLQDSRGFTLIEAIVAIGVISVGFVGALVLLSKSASQASLLKNRVIAAHLAEEGVEVIYNIRDTNWLKDMNWRTGLSDTAFALVDYNSTAIDISANVASRDCLNYTAGFYKHSALVGGCNTTFKRHVELSTGPADPNLSGFQPLIVKSVVTWQEKGQTHSPVTVIDYLYDWK